MANKNINTDNVVNLGILFILNIETVLTQLIIIHMLI
jgi:hypothetical protein